MFEAQELPRPILAEIEASGGYVIAATEVVQKHIEIGATTQSRFGRSGGGLEKILNAGCSIC